MYLAELALEFSLSDSTTAGTSVKVFQVPDFEAFLKHAMRATFSWVITLSLKHPVVEAVKYICWGWEAKMIFTAVMGLNPFYKRF